MIPSCHGNPGEGVVNIASIIQKVWGRNTWNYFPAAGLVGVAPLCLPPGTARVCTLWPETFQGSLPHTLLHGTASLLRWILSAFAPTVGLRGEPRSLSLDSGSQLCDSLTLCSQASHLTSVGLRCPFCKLGCGKNQTRSQLKESSAQGRPSLVR